jgi:hypothetical protein
MQVIDKNNSCVIFQKTLEGTIFKPIDGGDPQFARHKNHRRFSKLSQELPGRNLEAEPQGINLLPAKCLAERLREQRLTVLCRAGNRNQFSLPETIHGPIETSNKTLQIKTGPGLFCKPDCHLCGGDHLIWPVVPAQVLITQTF